MNSHSRRREGEGEGEEQPAAPPPIPPLPPPPTAPPALSALSGPPPPIPPLPILDQEHGKTWVGYHQPGNTWVDARHGVYGPRVEHLTRCANAKPLKEWDDPSIACEETGVSPLMCVRSPILCGSCAIHRFHYSVGYGRPLNCKCMWCQHNRVGILPYDPELEFRFTGMS